MSEKKEQISKIIKDLNKNIIFIDKKLGQLFDFMIINKEKKLDIELTITFFNNIYNDYITTMTNNHDIDIEGCETANSTTHGFKKTYCEKNNLISCTLNYFNDTILAEKNNLVDYDHIDKSHVIKIIQINEHFIINYINKICDEEAEKLFSLKLYFVEKREYYENLTKLYTIPNNLSFIHIITSIVILIFIFIIKTIVMQIYNYIYTFTNMQCNNISIS
jgi:hypothetical protein